MQSASKKFSLTADGYKYRDPHSNITWRERDLGALSYLVTITSELRKPCGRRGRKSVTVRVECQAFKIN